MVEDFMKHHFSPNTKFPKPQPPITFVPCMGIFLEAEYLVFEHAHWSGLLISKLKSGLLHGTDHGWWATDHDLDILGRRREFGLYIVSFFALQDLTSSIP
jgi:hypothetical protein